MRFLALSSVFCVEMSAARIRSLPLSLEQPEGDKGHAELGDASIVNTFQPER